MFGKIAETVLLCDLKRFKMKQMPQDHNTVFGIALLQAFSCAKNISIYVNWSTIFVFFCTKCIQNKESRNKQYIYVLKKIMI